MTGNELENGVGSGTVGRRRMSVSSGRIFNAHFCPNDNSPLCIFHRASDAPSSLGLR